MGPRFIALHAALGSQIPSPSIVATRAPTASAFVFDRVAQPLSYTAQPFRSGGEIAAAPAKQHSRCLGLCSAKNAAAASE